ncbi:ATP-binding cassette domain-containing protein [Actinoplanes sp. NPDC026670]|uniref:ATP-binding cassette domain-containing protein n=1 Tax=Actinoplanes sp. NPDC026670 TaxID=3154700 RepID=UPI003407968B
MNDDNETPLVVDLGGDLRTLPADDVHYLRRDGDRLTVDVSPGEDGDRQLGYFIKLLGNWFFHAANVPAARVLRIDGHPVRNARQRLSATDPVRVHLVGGVSTGPLRPRPPGPPGNKPPTVSRPGPRPPRGTRRYTIGRTGTHADIEVDDPLVRAGHATVRLDSQGAWWISGEVWVDGARRMSAVLTEGDTFIIGQTVLTVSAALLPDAAAATGTRPGVRRVIAPARRSSAETGLGVRLDHVTVYGDHGNKRLDDVTLEIKPMEVVAVVGPSGAGKSSLINVLLGELLEDSGTVLIGLDTGKPTDPQLRRRQVRYVPQGDDGLFKTLTVRETLTYAAKLRAAAGTPQRELDQRVDQVLTRLGLEYVEGNRIEGTSGGQKRRVSIGTELVGDPQLLLLDEPTSGLDPGKDRAIMKELREIAETYRCTVVIVTHATEHLGYVDKILTVRRGGRVHDAGPPDRVLAQLGQPSWADLMIDLDREPGAQPAQRAAGERRARPVLPLGWTASGLGTLVRRQAVLTARRGAGSLAVLLAMPVVCTLLAVIASAQGLRPGAEMGPVLSILVTVAALAGAALTYPDIVNDADKLHRDFRVGTEAAPMVLSKAIVYSGLCGVLAALVTGVFAGLRELPPAAYGLPPAPMLYLIVLLTMLASMGLGLLISARAPSLERAVTWSTLLAVLQVALSGTLFQLKGAFGVVSAVFPARLGLGAVASYADFNRFRQAPLYQDGLWEAGAGQFWLLVVLLLGVTGAALAGAVVRLHRRFTR